MNATVHESTLAAAPESAARVSAEVLFRAHASFVAMFLRRLGATPHEIDDLVQDVFLVVHRRGGFVPGAAHARTWLAEIGLRSFSTLRRTSKRRRTASMPGEFFAALPATAPSPFDTAASAQGLCRVQRAIDEMELDLRAVFLLFEIEGDSCDSIAAAMRIPVGTVYSRLHAARRIFRKVHERLDRQPRLDESEQQELARFAMATHPAFDVSHGLARFRASVQSLSSGPPHALAGGSHPCAIAVSLAAHLGLGILSAAWVTRSPPVARAEIEPIAVSVEEDSNDPAVRGEGRGTSASEGDPGEGAPPPPRAASRSARGRALRAGPARDARPREMKGASDPVGEPSVNWSFSADGDAAEVTRGRGRDRADGSKARGADGTGGAARIGGNGGGQGPAASVAAGSGERGHARGAQLLPEWDCDFPEWVMCGGIVRMVVTVRPDGTAAAAEILSDPGQGFADVARACAMRQPFVPARDEHGKAVLGKTGAFNVRFIR